MVKVGLSIFIFESSNRLSENRTMCYSDDARPPLPPVGGAAADQGEITLTAADGTKFMGYYARAAEPTGAGMIVLPDVRGLHQFFKELAQRFAEAGIDSVAIDYFARTAEDDDRSDTFEYMPHVQQTTPESIAADVAAAVDYLKSPEGGGTKSVFTVGFCFGGSNSWNQSAQQPGLAGAIGFYGRPVRSEPFMSEMKAPLMLMVAGADGATTPEQNREFDEQLTAAGVPHETHVYKDAPHSFFDRSYAQWKDACDDAWRQMLDFVKKHS
jgi:carboxymethylenebutenolidase